MTAAQLTGYAEQGDSMKTEMMKTETVLTVAPDGNSPAVAGKRKRERGELSARPHAKTRKQRKIQSTLTTHLSSAALRHQSRSPPIASPFFPTPSTASQSQPASPLPASLHALLTTHPTLPPFRRLVLLTLCQVPRSRTTTYAALAGFLRSHPRAVGNAMRHNPFAPRVPCHRVVASGGGIGGFAGEWGDGGKVMEKVGLLRDEGVVVEEVVWGGKSGKGKKARWRVRGEVWEGFVAVGDVAVGVHVESG